MIVKEKNEITYIESELLNKYPDITSAFSTKKGLNRTSPYGFNLSYNVKDNEEAVNENRKQFFSLFNISSNRAAFQYQIHSDIITTIKQPGYCGESDAMITNLPNIPLFAVSADCTLVFLYDFVNRAIAAIHSGWRGTKKQIVSKTVQRMEKEFNTIPGNLAAWVSPCISAKNYEVGEEVASQFDDKYIVKQDNSLYMDIAFCNIDMLINSGVKLENIDYSDVCSFAEKDLLHSYRRDGINSGRALGFIMLHKED